MTYPICIECDHFHDEAILGPQGQLGHVALCYNKEHRNPVSGKPLTCADCRQAEALCGLQGKGFTPIREPDAQEAREPRGPVTLEIVKD